MEKLKQIALVAHDNKKKDLIEWVEWNYKTLAKHQLICTGTTGKLVEETILKKREEYKNNTLLDMQEEEDEPPVNVTKLKSGPLGGDQQIGAMISEGKIDVLIFFWDPMKPQPHDVDVKALLRIAVVYNIPSACNRSTADFMISSPLLNDDYIPIINDYQEYLHRQVSP